MQICEWYHEIADNPFDVLGGSNEHHIQTIALHVETKVLFACEWGSHEAYFLQECAHLEGHVISRGNEVGALTQF
jgi:hypothetical protein